LQVLLLKSIVLIVAISRGSYLTFVFWFPFLFLGIGYHNSVFLKIRDTWESILNCYQLTYKHEIEFENFWIVIIWGNFEWWQML
jgi:hypothetical protein